MTEMELRNKVVTSAAGFIGCRESDGSHKKIIDLYNSHTPRARGYKLKYTDSWCAGFGSAVAIQCGLTDIIPTEVSCQKQIQLFKENGCWQESDSYVPQPGDYLFYDWQDTGEGDNTGWSDHVGIVEKVEDSTIHLIEGNRSNSVCRCTVAVNGRYIRGFGVPDYASKADAAQPESSTEPAYTVHTVVRGNSLWAISAKYLGKGSRYKEIMELNGLRTTAIHVGHKLKIPKK